MKLPFFLISFLVLFLNSSAQVFVPPVPDDAFPVQFEGEVEADSIYYLTALYGGAQATQVSVFDHQGFLRWYQVLPSIRGYDFKFHESVNQYSITEFDGSGLRFLILNTAFEIIDTLFTSSPFGDLHDIHIESDGSYWIAGLDTTEMDLSDFDFNGIPGSPTNTVLSYALEGYNPAGLQVFEWNSIDHLSVDVFYDYYGYNPESFDYCHGNSFDFDEQGDIYISMRHGNCVLKIDHQTGEILWILGGKNNDFTFTNDPGFSGQHDARYLGNGQISVYDNGNMASPQKSRAITYQLDTNNWTASRIQSFEFDPPYFAFAMGNNQTLENGQQLIGTGFIDQDLPNFIHLDVDGSVLSTLTTFDPLVSYRSFLEVLPFPETTEINCIPTDDGWALQAPPSIPDVKWSNGAESSEISIVETGYYQFWYPFGEGYLGSEPYLVSNLENPCLLNSIEEVLFPVLEQQYTYYNLLGEQVEYPEKGKLYIRYLPNGLASWWMQVD